MKNLIAILLLSITVFSCNEKKPGLVSLSGAGEYITETKEELEPKSDWSKFEDEVFQSIDSILNPNLPNKKTSIEKFLTYSTKVDGAIAELYYDFIFLYPSDSSEDFFSVFEETDTLLLDRWAFLAAYELSNEAFNLPEEKDMIKNYGIEFRQKISTLSSKNKKLAFRYIEKVISQATGE